MKRRDFTTGLLLAAAARPALGQQPERQHRIAIVSPATPVDLLTEAAGSGAFRAFFKELRRLGYVEGRNLTVDRFSAEGHPDRYAELAHEVVSRKPDLIWVSTGVMARTFATATSTIPILTTMTEPVRQGFAASLARPGGNITGVTVDAGIEIQGKSLQILKEAVPSATNVGYLAMRVQWDGVEGTELRRASRQLGIFLDVMLLEESTPSEYLRVFAEIAQWRPDAIIVSARGDLLAQRQLIAELAENNRLPSMYAYRDFVEAGGLMAYGPDLVDLARHIADDVHEILNGGKPGDIPIYQPTKFELIINLKTAKLLGLTVPPALLARADEVIE